MSDRQHGQLWSPLKYTETFLRSFPQDAECVFAISMLILHLTARMGAKRRHASRGGQSKGRWRFWWLSSEGQ